MLGAYYQKNALPSSVTDAAVAGDEFAFCTAMYRAQCAAFLDLFETRNALARIQLADPLPAEALADFLRMQQTAVAATAKQPTPIAKEVPVAPVVVETPVEVCAREFRELSSDRWKKKWLLDQRNRPVADLCAAEGRI